MILITGATGTTGTEIVQKLANSGTRVRALVRNRQKAGAITGPNVEIVEGDLGQPETLAAPLEGVDRVLLLSSPDPRQVELQGNLIVAAKRAGVRHVVKFSAMGADAASRAALLRWHGQTEKQLENSGLAYTYLQPNQFMQNFLSFRATITTQGAFYAPLGDARMSLVDTRDIAAVAAVVLTGSGHERKKYVITGPEALTYSEAAGKLSAALGKKVSYVNVPPEAFKQGMTGAGLPEWLANAITELYAGWSGNSAVMVTNVVSEVGGKQPIRFEQFARDYAGLFTGSGASGTA